MNTPGFTAEASLRPTTNVYRATANIAPESDGIQMQMSWCFLRPGFEGGFWRCCRCWDDGSNCYCYNEPLPELFPDPTGELL